MKIWTAWLLSAGFATAALAQPPASAPRFAKGEDYAVVRAKLLRQGWQPLVQPGADECLPQDTRCQGRPEMSYCAGTGVGACRFTWIRGGRHLAICTAGEQPARFWRVCR